MIHRTAVLSHVILFRLLSATRESASSIVSIGVLVGLAVSRCPRSQGSHLPRAKISVIRATKCSLGEVLPLPCVSMESPVVVPPYVEPAGVGYWFRAIINTTRRCPMLAQSGQHSSLL